MPTRIAIAGAAGRMGRRMIALSYGEADLALVAALEQASCPAMGQDAGELAGVGRLGVMVSDSTDATFDVLIDFTLPEGTMGWLDLCAQSGAGMVIGTTGHTADQLANIRAAGEKIGILRAPNFSVGVNVMLRLTEVMARTLDESFDVEITETHHRFKVDAPSGTALALRDAVIRGRAALESPPPSTDSSLPRPPPAVAPPPGVIHGRAGHAGARPAGQIGIHSLRLGDVVGEHTVEFGALGESLLIAHTARSRDTFAAGALRAARWLAGRPPGLYGMADVLFGDKAPGTGH